MTVAVRDFTDTALGLVSAQSFPAIVGIADHMLKSSGVALVGYEKIGSGYCTAMVRGNIAEVRLAVAEGAERATQFGQTVSTLVLARPAADLEKILPIGGRLLQLAQQGRRDARLSQQAVGLLETRGFPAMVGAADAMLKSADVVLTAYEVIGAGLCTIIVRGSVANALSALDAGMAEAERIGELNAVMLVPRPLEDLDQTLPLASCWIEEVKPLQLPISIKEKTAEPLLVELPELKELAIPAAAPEKVLERIAEKIPEKIPERLPEKPAERPLPNLADIASPLPIDVKIDLNAVPAKTREAKTKTVPAKTNDPETTRRTRSRRTSPKQPPAPPPEP
jgi:carbon dioxide concentrating mechanism protein CcmO